MPEALCCCWHKAAKGAAMPALTMSFCRSARSSGVRMGLAPASPPRPATNCPPASRRSISARTDRTWRVHWVLWVLITAYTS
jgi:hypothetical protein